MMSPALKERIVALAREGKPPREILNIIDGACSLDSIYVTLSAERKVDSTIPRFGSPGRACQSKTVIFSSEALARLAPHAIRRGISVNELIRRLIDTVLDDHLIDGVLDDDDAEAAA